MELILKVHRTGDGRKITCVTDGDLLGRKFEEGKRQLDFSAPYYAGEGKPKDLIEKHIISSYMVVFSGHSSIKLGLDLSIIDEAHILSIKGVPQAQVLIG